MDAALDMREFSARLSDAVASSRTSGWGDRYELAMTDGYAELLRLEGARRRSRVRLQEILAGLTEDPKAIHVAAALTEEIAGLTRQVRDLRALLESAASELRAA